MKKIPLFGIGVGGKSSTVTSERRVNCYYELRPDGDKTEIAIYGTPGTSLWQTLAGTGPVRGLHVAYGLTPEVGNLSGTQIFYLQGALNTNPSLYVIYWSPDNGGSGPPGGWVSYTIGALNIGAGLPPLYNFYANWYSMSDNGTQLLIIGNVGGHLIPITIINYYTLGTTSGVSETAYSPQEMRSLTSTYLDGYFFIEDQFSGNKFYASGAFDVTTWGSLNYGQMTSAGNSIIAVDSDHGYLIVFGSVSIEFWSNVGSSGFPYEIISGTTAEIGLVAVWSRAHFDNSIAFLGQTVRGQVGIYEFNGYVPVKISTSDIDYIINQMSQVQDATAFSYTIDGSEFYQINFPTGNRSFLYCNTTQIWSEVQTGLQAYNRHAAAFGVTVPVTGAVNLSNNSVFNNVSSFQPNIPALVCDTSTGNLWQLVPGLNTDAITGSGGGQIERLIQTRHIIDDGNQIAIDEVFLDMETGVTPQGTNPKITMSVSKNGGHTFGDERDISIGKTGQYNGPRVTWRRLGAARDFVLRFRMTDNAKFVLTYGAAVLRGLGR
jgi:hypothetical protein